MNTLSWMLYAASVLGGVGVLFGVLAAFSVAFIGAAWLSRAMASDLVYASDMPSENRPIGSGDYQKWMTTVRLTTSKWLYVIPVAFAIIAAIIPSQKTIYMIMASEMGETVITSPEAREIFDDLRAVIKKKLADEVKS